MPISVRAWRLAAPLLLLIPLCAEASAAAEDSQPTTAQPKALDELQPLSLDQQSLHTRSQQLEPEINALESQSFSTTTRLSGQSTFVLGANFFTGRAASLVTSSRSSFGATTFNYDTKLSLDTSFSGSDLLHIRLRAGNFDRTRNTFGGAGPSALSQLEVAFQERSGADRLSLNRLYYQVPIGNVTITLGPKVEQDQMMAIWPSLYPSESILDLMTFAGAIGANNLNLGAGAGIWWQQDGLAISALYVAANGDSSESDSGGLFSSRSGSTTTLQVGYRQEQWAIAASYSYLQNGAGVIPYATNYTLASFEQPGSTSAWGISGYWQPVQSGWIPSISAGWGINHTQYSGAALGTGLVKTSQSWSLGLLWHNALANGNTLGAAIGQAVYATSFYGDGGPNDSNLIGEAWYQIQLTDAISITPAVFYLHRPLGASTPAGQSFNQVGSLLKLSFRF